MSVHSVTGAWTANCTFAWKHVKKSFDRNYRQPIIDAVGLLAVLIRLAVTVGRHVRSLRWPRWLASHVHTTAAWRKSWTESFSFHGAFGTSPVNDDINYSPCLDSHALSLRSLLSPSSSKHNAVNFLVIHHAERGFSSQSVCLSVCITQKRTISKYSNSL